MVISITFPKQMANIPSKPMEITPGNRGSNEIPWKRSSFWATSSLYELSELVHRGSLAIKLKTGRVSTWYHVRHFGNTFCGVFSWGWWKKICTILLLSTAACSFWSAKLWLEFPFYCTIKICVLFVFAHKRKINVMEKVRAFLRWTWL